MKSRVINLYKDWLETATPAEIELVDSIYHECEEHYSDGGDTVVETFTPAEILKEFKSVNDARSYCGLKVEQALNARWGEDTDPELDTSKRFDQWAKDAKKGKA